MVKCEVIDNFTLMGRFDELKNIKRANELKSLRGYLYVGDIIECEPELASYMANEEGHKNPANKPFVKIIEVIPEKKKEETKKTVKEETEEIKPKRKPRKKTIAND